MLGPPRSPRSPQRLPPPPSPSRSLRGMEKAIPPRTWSSSRSPLSSAGEVYRPLPPGTPFSPAADRNKPLPAPPRRSSSVYTADSGNSRIVDDYSNPSHEEERPVPTVLQPIAYQETISALLRRRMDDPASPKSVPSIMSVGSLASRSTPRSNPGYPDSPSTSAISAPSVASNRNAPSFKEFSRNLRIKRTEVVQSVAPRPSPHSSPDFRALPYESTRRISSISSRSSGPVERGVVPAPLFSARNRDTMAGNIPKNSDAYLRDEEERPISRFSSTSEDSFVIYTGVRESFRAYVRNKVRMSKKKKDSGKKERERVMSIASLKYPGMLTAKEYDRRLSSGSQRASFQQGISAVYRKLSKLSIGSSGQSKEEKKQRRGRKKQLAIPTSGYQKYGAAVWEASNRRRKKSKRESVAAKTSAMGPYPAEAGALRDGRGQIIHALDDRNPRLKRSDSEKRRETLKLSIKMVGPTDQVPDGVLTYRV